MSAAETAAFLALLWLARLRGVRMVWTVHDLGSNDHLHPTLERWFWRAYVPAIDALICLSERGRTLVVERFPALDGRPIHVVPLGGFADAYGASVSREDARARLGIGSQTPVMLHFGLLRPYKNVPHLIRTFRARAADDALLLVAGEPYDPIVEREVRQVAEGAGDVRLDLRWIPEDEVQQFFAAADLVVLPYRRILNSGAVLLAMTLARPVLVPDQGAMRDQREAFGADWVRLYEGELTSSTLMEALGWARTTRRRPLPPDLLDWRPRAQQVKAVYEQAITGRTAADPFGNRVASGGLRQ